MNIKIVLINYTDEICIKYKTTHDILIGGDLNEDLSKENGEKRSTYIKQFINDCNLNIYYMLEVPTLTLKDKTVARQTTFYSVKTLAEHSQKNVY